MPYSPIRVNFLEETATGWRNCSAHASRTQSTKAHSNIVCVGKELVLKSQRTNIRQHHAGEIAKYSDRRMPFSSLSKEMAATATANKDDVTNVMWGSDTQRQNFKCDSIYKNFTSS